MQISSETTGEMKWPKSYEMGEFCFENTFNGTSRQIKFYRNNGITFGKLEREKRAVIVANCMMMSCVFTILVLVVYWLVKELRNLPGLMLMAYVATFTAFSFLRIVHVYAYHYRILEREACIVMTLLVYYTILSSFSWMNVMSFDIWWTLRATRNHLKTNRRGILVKFGWYGLYGWGAPLLATAFVVATDHLDLPGIIKPQIFVGEDVFLEKSSTSIL
ncbi:G-protein coupled receptor Mth2-like [Choristoneura fumiferana]|uniref:G-protein coupled receptor Mth2-like n=1 Tax=Choristoneura fumiferana TaxID=7141 RepID=UPI003D15DCAE